MAARLRQGVIILEDTAEHWLQPDGYRAIARSRRLSPERWASLARKGDGMNQETDSPPKSQSQTYRAFLWCPANESSLILEFARGDRIRDLVPIIRDTWGDLPMDLGHRDMFQGWRLCAEGTDGILVPLHLEDELPVSPEAVSSLVREEDRLPRGEGSTRRDFERARIMDIFGAVLRPSSDHAETFDDQHFYEFTGRRFRGTPVRTGLQWPDSEERVNLRLCVILGITGG